MQNNKVTTYLLYAVGEIILVVIGILIAVSIDNWNEERKNVTVVRNAVREIMEDNIWNIVTGNLQMKEIERIDSLASYILLKNPSKQEYILPEYLPLAYILDNQISFDIKSEGYKSYIASQDTSFLSSKIRNLLFTYHVPVNDNLILPSVKEINQHIKSYREYLMKNEPWYYTLLQNKDKGIISDEHASYLAQDPYYRNWVYQYHKMLKNTEQALLGSVYFNLKIFESLAKRTDESRLKEIEKYRNKVKKEERDLLVGTYTLGKEKMVFVEKGDDLLLIEDGAQYPITKIGDNKYYIAFRYPFYLYNNNPVQIGKSSYPHNLFKKVN